MPSTEEGRFYMPLLMMQPLCLLLVVKYVHQNFWACFLFLMHMLDNSRHNFGMQLNNLELAVNLAKRANLPGAENLVSSTTFMIDKDASITFLAINGACFYKLYQFYTG